MSCFTLYADLLISPLNVILFKTNINIINGYRRDELKGFYFENYNYCNEC